MTHSKAILGTDKKNLKLNWFQYWFGHCFLTGWQTIEISFRHWRNLMTGNYDNYALLEKDDPETECKEWFWVSLGEDNVYPKEFLEYLMFLADDAQKHPEKLVKFESIKELHE